MASKRWPALIRPAHKRAAPKSASETRTRNSSARARARAPRRWPVAAPIAARRIPDAASRAALVPILDALWVRSAARTTSARLLEVVERRPARAAEFGA